MEGDRSKMKVLKFWTHRGGRYFNSGHIDFVGFETIEEGVTFEDHFYYEEKEKWYEANGNELDYEINEDGTGYVNVDHDYDTTTCVLENNLNTKQINAIQRMDSNCFINEEELKIILNKHYPYEQHK